MVGRGGPWLGFPLRARRGKAPLSKLWFRVARLDWAWLGRFRQVGAPLLSAGHGIGIGTHGKASLLLFKARRVQARRDTVRRGLSWLGTALLQLLEMVAGIDQHRSQFAM